MALNNYTALQASVADWLNRSDLTSQIPDFILLAETQLNRQLRVRDMLSRQYTTASSQYVALPTDYSGIKSIQLNTNPVTRLDYAPPESMADRLNDHSTGKPQIYTIVNNQIELAPAPDASYEMEIVYWQRIPSLASNSTNWLLTKHPDVYLYGTLLQAAPYLRDDDRIAVWQGLQNAALNDINVDNERAERSGQPLKTRIRPF
jgi:hypothetical protein